MRSLAQFSLRLVTRLLRGIEEIRMSKEFIRIGGRAGT